MAESNGASSHPEEAAADSTLALNPVVGFGFDDIVKAGVSVVRQGLLQPAIGIEHATRLWQESVRILFGASDAAPDPKDARFRDPAFSENGFYKRAAQTWVAAERTVHEWVDAVGFDDLGRQRAHFLLGLAADGLVPTNFLLGNPSALKKARETRGRSLSKARATSSTTWFNNGGMPSQVDKTPFTVGGNLANTEGVVVFRHPILELIQYRPRTPNVETRPVFIVPPQINKYYVYDLSPEKSLVKFLLDSGFQVFMVSWRNPTAEHRDWGLGRLHRRDRSRHRSDARNHRASQRRRGRRLRRRHHADGRDRLHGGARTSRSSLVADADGQRAGHASRRFGHRSVHD